MSYKSQMNRAGYVVNGDDASIPISPRVTLKIPGIMRMIRDAKPDNAAAFVAGLLDEARKHSDLDAGLADVDRAIQATNGHAIITYEIGEYQIVENKS